MNAQSTFPPHSLAVIPGLVRQLTPAERRVAALVGEGLAYRVIGARLHCTERMVRAHIESIATKLAESELAPVELTPKQRVRLYMLRR